ncbi:MAG: PQQ-dependent sugar dehydrogenase [Gammaproteobacteria bacterium]
MNAKPASSLTAFVYAIACTLAGVYGGYFYSREFRVIPCAILPLPEVHVSFADTHGIALIFAVSVAVVAVLLTLLRGPNRYDELQRFVTGYLGFLVAFTFASLYLFIATNINYDPQLIGAVGILTSVLLVGGFALRAGGMRRFVHGVLAAVSGILRRFLTVHGVLVLLFMCTPLILAKAFLSSRDIANVITQVRIYMSEAEQGDWQLVNALGDSVFLQPMQVRLAPDDDTVLYVLERAGRLLKVPYPAGGAQDLVLDITTRVGEAEVENGALGFAFHPAFGKANRHVYLYYTDVHAGEQFNRLSRFDLGAGDAATVAASETPLIDLARESSGFHNGGSLEFGPDGFLYVAFGEGLRTPAHASPAEVLRGAILRLDVDQQGGTVSHPIVRSPANGTTANYFIPNDNPFVGRADILEEYWALGLRNPFRMSFDRATGRLWAGDVGSTVWEEINLIEPGRHYQFPYVEGHGTVTDQELIGAQQGPVYTYEHTAFDRAVIGGIVYRGKRHPALAGHYVFADSYSAKLFTMPSDQPRVDVVTTLARAEQYAQRGVSSVTALSDGEILITVLGAASSPGGEILKLARGTTDDKLTATAAAPADSTPEPAREYSLADARSLFKVNCARCHGFEGRGDGPDAESLGVAMPDFTSAAFQSSRDAARIRAVIEKGGAGTGLSPMMPPWKGFLSDSDVDFLVRYVRELGDAS